MIRHSRRTGLLLICIVVLFSTGCATQSSSGPPPVEYIPDSNYYLLMAEIAFQRNENLVAATEYLNAAQQSTDIELAQRATEFAFEYGYDVFALSGVRRWIELDPDNRLAHEIAGKLHLRRNELDRSRHHWQLALGPVEERTDDDYVSMGANLAGEDNASGATQILIRMSVGAPESAGLNFALAQAALRSGAFELALDSARRAAVLDPESVEPQVAIARALLATGAEYQAIEQMENLVTNNPALGLETEYVRLLVAADRNQRAEQKLRDLVGTYGPRPELIRVHAMMSLAAGNLAEAERDYTELLDRGDDVYQSIFYLGQIGLLGGAYNQAIEILKRVRGGPFLLPAQFRIAGAYGGIGDYQTGIDYLDAFAEEFPRYAVDVLAPQAQLLQQMGRTDEALQKYDMLVGLKPNTVSHLIARAMLLDQAGRLNDAIEGMEQAVDVAPANANALNTLGYTLANRTGNLTRSHRLIRMALEIEPDSPAIIDSMGWVLFRQGRLEEARSYLELAYSMLDDPELVAHLGEVLWVTGEQDRAKELWDRSLAANPDSKPLKETMARFVQ